MDGDGLDILDPQPGVVQFRGERLEIQPLTIGQLPRFSRLIRPVITDMLNGAHPQWERDDNVMVMELLELHGDAIIEAAAIASGRDVGFIAGNTDSAELLALAKVVVEVNRDFFIRAVRAARAALNPEAGLSAAALGPRPSSTSSVPATH